MLYKYKALKTQQVWVWATAQCSCVYISRYHLRVIPWQVHETYATGVSKICIMKDMWTAWTFIYKFSLSLFLFCILNNIFYQKVFFKCYGCIFGTYLRSSQEINVNWLKYFEAEIIVKYLIKYMCANNKYKTVSRN